MNELNNDPEHTGDSDDPSTVEVPAPARPEAPAPAPPSPAPPALAPPSLAPPTPAAPAPETPSPAAPAPETPSPAQPAPETPSSAPPAPRPPSPALLAARAAKPGPPARPGPAGPAPTTPVAVSQVVTPGASAAAAHGRVGDDGTVYVRDSDGSERPVGQWAAGDPGEGLAFFALKYDDLAVELGLATHRLRGGKAAVEQAVAVVKKVREALAEPAMVGDLAALGAQVDALESLIEVRRAAAAADKAAARAQILAAREAIAAEAESLAESVQWKSTGERYKTLLDEWKSAPRADRNAEQDLWKRFSHARSVFDKHRRQHFAKLDSERADFKTAKEGLVAEAEALSSSTEWGPTAGAYRDLMERWKALGRAGKADEETLWERFRGAQDTFFSARNSTFDERDKGQKENLSAKLELLREAEAIDISKASTAKATLRSIQDRWEELGHVPRADKERLESRLRRVEDAIRGHDEDRWRRSNPEALARAEGAVAQFRTTLERLEADRAKAQGAGDERKAGEIAARIESAQALLAAAERAATEFGG